MKKVAADMLTEVRGKFRENVSLEKTVWFQVGGKADMVFRPADIDDLSDFLRAYPASEPLIVIGVGSNLLVRDGGVRGVVVRLSAGFSHIDVQGDTMIVGAGVLDKQVAAAAAVSGIAGFSFLVGIPGTIGGAVKMNAGAYGAEMKDVLISATFVDRSGRIFEKNVDELGFRYRGTEIPDDWIVVEATLRSALKASREDLKQEMLQIMETRAATQPITARTSGSTFQNPPGLKAWALIDQAGCRGLKKGGAMMSEQHCNFMLNVGAATAADLEMLGEEVRQRVLESSGVMLVWEVKRIGES